MLCLPFRFQKYKFYNRFCQNTIILLVGFFFFASRTKFSDTRSARFIPFFLCAFIGNSPRCIITYPNTSRSAVHRTATFAKPALAVRFYFSFFCPYKNHCNCRSYNTHNQSTNCTLYCIVLVIEISLRLRCCFVIA